MIATLFLAGLLGAAAPTAPSHRFAPILLNREQTSQATFEVDRIRGRWIDLGPAIDGQVLFADLIRADVDISTSPSNRLEIKVDAEAPSTDLARIRLRISTAADGVLMTDLFPARTGLTKECLPPPSERGDIWVVTSRLKVAIRLPRTMTTRVQVREGRVIDHRGAA